MIYNKLPVILYLLFLLLEVELRAQPVSALPRSVPEAEGISSEGIIRFLEAAGKSKHEFHSFMLVRHGKVIAEGWWNPYRPELKHTMYSVSKSFTSTAVGFAVSEKRLTIHDKVISFFPDQLPDSISVNLQAMTVKDLLTMSAGQDPDPTFQVASNDSNWVKRFLAIPLVNKPGSKFLYNSLATYMLSAIVQKVSGQTLLDYLTPRLFNPLGIQGADWEIDPKGIHVGGWGLRVKTEDMAKLGQLYLQKGNWHGKQILPAAWVEEATSFKIQQATEKLPAHLTKDSSDWHQGYCYQFWRSRNNAYRADGAFGQFILVMPDQDAVLAITAESPDMQDELNLVSKYLLPAMHKDKLPANAPMAASLKQQLSALALPVPARSSGTPLVSTVSGRTFTLSANEKNIEAISFQFKDNLCHVSISQDQKVHKFIFGSALWKAGETSRRGPYLLNSADYEGLPPLQVTGIYRWREGNTLELTLRYIESPHTETFLCQFDENNLTVNIHNSYEPKTKQVSVKGKAKDRVKVAVPAN